jgi:hypothetical protein
LGQTLTSFLIVVKSCAISDFILSRSVPSGAREFASIAKHYSSVVLSKIPAEPERC